MDANKIGALESILFAYGEPLSKSYLSKKLNISEENLTILLNDYIEQLNNSNRGLTILLIDDTIQLVTKPEYKDYIDSIVKDEFKEELSPAALETLTIIAYLGPIHRSLIDQIRGVNSSFILRNLLIRGLIERKSKGHSFIYELSSNSLRHLGIQNKQELPDYEKYKNIVQNLMEQNNSYEQSN
ncbi:MAG: SMC-Scp complex subunit ScpB [Minisyncoccia bacterium]